MGKLHQARTAIACSMGNALIGSLYVWPSYTLHSYGNNTKILSAPMTDIESSLVGSIPSLGGMLGSLLVGMIISTFGRRNGGLIMALPLTISWLVIDLTSSSTVILVARFVSGVASGGILVHSPIFISEVADKSIRGMLTSAPNVLYCFGTLLSYIFGWFLSYRHIIWSNVAMCVMYIALLMSVKESPLYLLRKNRVEEASLSIAHYLGVPLSSKEVLEEISRLKQSITPAAELLATDPEAAEKAELKDENECGEKSRMSSFKLLFLSPTSRRAFIVVGLIFLSNVMMGMVAVQIYAKQIFSSAVPGISSHLCSVMLATVLFFGSLITTMFSDRFGRRILLLLSSILVALCLAGMGTLMMTGVLPPWVIAVLILVYCFCFMFGSGSVPYVLLAEVFAPEVQNLASTILMEWVWFLNFSLLSIFPFIVKLLGIPGSFFCFAGFSVLNVFIAIFLVPETKELSNEEIQELFRRRTK